MGKKSGIFENVDYPELHRQRALLRHVEYTFAEDGRPEEADAIRGLTQLLDDFVDTAAKRLGKQRVFSVEGKNENCLRGIRCPKCGSESRFDVEVKTLMDVTDDGTGFHKDADWGLMSYIACGECDHQGLVWQFQA